MKPTLVFALLMLFLYTVCGELAETSAVRSLSQSRRLQEVVGDSGAGVGEVKNSDGMKCDPIPYVDFGFERFGETYVKSKVVAGAAACLSACTPQLGCVALNYYPDTRICATLTSVTAVKEQKEKLSSTFLIVFNNDYVCDPGNFIPGYHRVGQDYARIEGVETPQDCCKKCLEQDTKCMAWDYNDTTNVCFLKTDVPVLRANNGDCTIYTGLGGFCPLPSSQSTT